MTLLYVTEAQLRLLVGIHNYDPTGLPQAVDFLSKFYKTYPFEELVSKPYSLTEAGVEDALKMAATGQYHRVALTHWV